jgi:hypothetical protein
LSAFLFLTRELLPNFIFQLSTKGQFQGRWWVRAGDEVVRAEVFKYSGTTLKNQNLVYEEIKSILI